jgi:hypothetical protein
LTDQAFKQREAVFNLVSRPGLTYSLRANVNDEGGKRNRPVYCLLDVIISETDPWFLSVCFYEDDITDPQELGDAIPGGLFNETGYCFDLDENDPELVEYIAKRIAEAGVSALAAVS